MFTGIIEDLGIVKNLVAENDNLHLTIESVLAPELKIDQSVSHNGVCLTVIALTENSYTVTAIKETLDKTNLNSLQIGATVNLERGLKLGARLDGHMVQGHVDQIGTCPTPSIFSYHTGWVKSLFPSSVDSWKNRLAGAVNTSMSPSPSTSVTSICALLP